MSGTVYTCTQHPNYRWFDTKPGGKLCFSGELPTPEFPTGRPGWEGPTALTMLKARMEGVNPYCPSIKDEDGPFTDIKQVRELMAWIDSIETRWVFECDCPRSDFVRTDPAETYEQSCARISLPPREES
jgi:hypothetical protein